MSSMEAPHVDLGLTFGSIEIGMVLAVFLTGIATLQTWNYYRNYSEDAAGLKYLVGFVYLADTVHSIMLVDAIYQYTIVSFGNYAALEVLAKSSSGGILVAGFVAFSVQTFYCIRVYRVTHSRVIASICWVLALLREVFSISIFAIVYASGRFEAFETRTVHWQLIVMQSVGAASDVLIAGFICFGILRLRSGITSSDKLIDKLIAFSIGSGMLTSIVAIGEMITFVTMRNFVFITFYSILAKLFTNSLLASLNERNALRREMAPWNSMHTRGRAAQSTRLSFKPPERNIAVELNIQQETMYDDSVVPAKSYETRDASV